MKLSSTRLRASVLAGALLANSASGFTDRQTVQALPTGTSPSQTSVFVPDVFQVTNRGGVESVAYAESSGETLNVVDPQTIRQMCANYSAVSGTLYSPKFEAGYDSSVKYKTWRFTNKQHWANYTQTDRYICENQGKRPPSEESMCNCTYRTIPNYTAQIKTTTEHELEIVDLDFSKKQAQRRKVRSSAKIDTAVIDGQALMTQFAPEVVGKNVVAGIPCVVRRRKLGGDSHVDICISDDPDGKLPSELRYRTLSEYMPRPDGKGVYRSSQTDRIVIDGAVDSGAFRIPDGFTVKDLP